MLDLLIENGRLYPGDPASDMTTEVGYVGIKDDKIVSIGPGTCAREARLRIDAAGKAVCPGFIDIHSHSDIFPLADGRVESKIRQGVTTEVIGNCGYSVAPYGREVGEEIRRDAGRFGIEPDWSSVAGYLKRLDRADIAVNYCFLLGHGTLRAFVIGYEDRKPTAKELRRMSEELETAFEAGAFGFSTGLVYAPGIFAGTDEIIGLARTAAAHGGIYASHVRGEGDTLLEALREAVEIGSESGAPVQISHLKAAGRNNWSKLEPAIEMIEKARREGVDITADRYPYEAGNTDLVSVLPDWAHSGGIVRLLERLESPMERTKIAEELEADDEFRPEEIMISNASEVGRENIIGRDLKSIAEERSLPAGEMACDMLYRNGGNVSIIAFCMEGGQSDRVIGLPWVMVGSDASARAVSGPLAQGLSHPRAFGTFPRVLSRLRDSGGKLTTTEAVYKMTRQPADRLGLYDRGRLDPGCFADLVVFDPNEVRDPATYEKPHQFPGGIDHVIVNGRPVITDGDLTSHRPGRVLRPA